MSDMMKRIHVLSVDPVRGRWISYDPDEISYKSESFTSAAEAVGNLVMKAGNCPITVEVVNE